ncbi:PIN-like domain-containing protein [Leucobacter sp. M11]|uniref:PIN-like domain-containing protein n=1 Tax=Leucobacter sp. M11 TaxID=2993565 RepID=UPI002D80E587|nr:PIN domain-containing protein [Leucobacter sp. M11]MEB4614785.1 PIN domain-containing protein [Leucobacter sp. M11]
MLRESFRAYYKPSDSELSEIWAEGHIILDTNALLNFFRYTPGTRDEFLTVLKKLSSSLWLPHHVGLEFQRRRLTVISSTADAFNKVTEALTKAESDIASTLNGYKHHPSLNRSELNEKLSSFFGSLTTELKEQQDAHKDLVIGKREAEQTFDQISDLFTGKVGPSFAEDELESICVEGKTRYEKQIPPGFKDKNDKDPNQYGDLIIWKEILRFGAESKKPVIFVTDDAKEDWWWRSEGKTQGPRVELVNEFWEAAAQRIHFYEPLRFLEYAKVRTKTSISTTSLEEVEEVSSANSRAQRILRERQQAMELQQKHLVRRLEQRSKQEELGNFASHGMNEDLHKLDMEKNELENEIALLQLKRHYFESELETVDDQEARHAFFNKVKNNEQNIVTLEHKLRSLIHSRDLIMHRISDPGPSGGMSRATLERQLHHLQHKLAEVNLALEELNE